MRRPPRSVLLGAAVLVGVLVVATVVRACSGPATTITVYGASSLRTAFPELAEAFEEQHDVGVELTFASSGDLAGRLQDGDGADVFAGADPVSLARAQDSLAGEPVVFTQNRLVLAVPRGNPAGIERVGDLARATLIATCDIDAPCGRLGNMTLTALGIATPPIVGADARATLALVTGGDAQAGLVYATDARAAGDEVEVIELPRDQHRVAFYGIGEVVDSSEPDEAREFIDFVLSDAGQEILADAGFASAENPHLQPED